MYILKYISLSYLYFINNFYTKKQKFGIKIYNKNNIKYFMNKFLYLIISL